MSADTSTIELAAIAPTRRQQEFAPISRCLIVVWPRSLPTLIGSIRALGGESTVPHRWSAGSVRTGAAPAARRHAVIAANVTDTTIDLFAEAEAELVPLLGELSVDQTSRVVKEWSQRAKASLGEDGAEPEPGHDRVHFSPMLDNTWKLDGILAGENAKTVDTALDACLPELIPGEPVLPASQRYAAALVEMARRSMQHVSPSARRSIDMTVLIDWQDYVNGGVARYTDGTTLAPDRVRRLLCDAKLTFIQLGEHGEPLWM